MKYKNYLILVLFFLFPLTFSYPAWWCTFDVPSIKITYPLNNSNITSTDTVFKWVSKSRVTSLQVRINDYWYTAYPVENDWAEEYADIVKFETDISLRSGRIILLQPYDRQVNIIKLLGWLDEGPPPPPGCNCGPIWETKAQAVFRVSPSKKHYNKPIWETFKGDPVSISNGHVFIPEADVMYSDMLLARNYDNQYKYNDGFGYGWSSPFMVKLLKETDDELVLCDDMGRRIEFWYANESSYYGNNPMRYGGIKIQNDQYILRDYENNTYAFETTTGLLQSLISNTQVTVANYSYQNNKVSSITDQYGKSFYFMWDEQENIQEIRYPDNSTTGRILKYRYDSYGNLTSVVNSVGLPVSYFYDDPTTHWITKREYAGQSMYYHYNAYDRATVVSGDEGYQYYNFSLDTSTMQTLVTDKYGVSELYQWNYFGVIETTYFSDSSMIVNEWDGSSQNISRNIDEGNRIIDSFYDSESLLRFTIQYSGVTNFSYVTTYEVNPVYTDITTITVSYVTSFSDRTTLYSYNEETDTTPGRLLESITDPIGNMVVNLYDSYARLTSVSYYTNRVYQFSEQLYYDQYGNMTSFIRPDGSTFQVLYDNLGHSTCYVFPTGERIFYSFDEYGNLLTASNEVGQQTIFEYDGMDQLVRTTSPGNRVSEYIYDDHSNLVSSIDPGGHVNQYYYDQYDRLTCSILCGAETTCYYFDSYDLMTASSNSNGVYSYYTVDLKGRPFKSINALGQYSQVYYDTVGRVTAQRLFDGTIHHYWYNTFGEMTQFTYGGENSTSILTGSRYYDLIGRETSLFLPDRGRVNKEYDVFGNLVKYIYGSDTSQFSYDVMGRRTSYISPAGLGYSYSYDSSGRPTEIINWANQTTRYYYDLLGRVTSCQYANQIRTHVHYDEIGQLNEIQYLKPNGLLIESLTYEYDTEGLCVWMKSSLSEETTYYYYDTYHRLTGEFNPGMAGANKVSLKNTGTGSLGFSSNAEYRLMLSVGDVVNGKSLNNNYRVKLGLNASVEQTGRKEYLNTYRYDPIGNRLEMVSEDTSTYYAYDVLDRITSSHTSQDSTFWEYDQNGQVTQKGSWNYQWNASGQLVSVGDVEYRYDEMGRRNLRIYNGSTTEYVYDGLTPVIERVNGVTQKIYTLNGGVVGQIISVRENGQDYYFNYDRQGNVRFITNSSGNVISRFEQDAYGNVISVFGNDQFNRHFITKEKDPQTGLYYFGSRWYDPETGRWLSPEPLGLDGPNLYQYGFNDPVNNLDPDGYLAIRINVENYMVQVGKLKVLDFEKRIMAPLGHSAVVAIDEKTGNVRYYEYGRYSAGGSVKEVTLDCNKVQMYNGKPTSKSLKSLYKAILTHNSDNNSHTFMRGRKYIQLERMLYLKMEYYPLADYNKVVNYCKNMERNNSNPKRPLYNILNHNCFTFSESAIVAGYYPATIYSSDIKNASMMSLFYMHPQ